MLHEMPADTNTEVAVFGTICCTSYSSASISPCTIFNHLINKNKDLPISDSVDQSDETEFSMRLVGLLHNSVSLGLSESDLEAFDLKVLKADLIANKKLTFRFTLQVNFLRL